MAVSYYKQIKNPTQLHVTVMIRAIVQVFSEDRTDRQKAELHAALLDKPYETVKDILTTEVNHVDRLDLAVRNAATRIHLSLTQASA